MFDILRSRHVRDNEDAEAFEGRFDQPAWAPFFQYNSNDPSYQTTYGQLRTFGSNYGYISVLPGQ